MRVPFIVLRVAGAGAVLAAIIGQYLTSWEFWVANDIEDRFSTTVNFFSFFTIESNILTVVVFAIGAVLLIRSAATESNGFAVFRASVTAYMVTTGVVYNMLLRGIELPQGSTLAWSNEILHVVAPILIAPLSVPVLIFGVGAISASGGPDQAQAARATTLTLWTLLFGPR